MYKFVKILGFLVAVQLFAFDGIAVEYRIDNEIGTVKSTVYLLENQFVSMIDTNGEIAVFDAAEKTFTLLNPPLRLQTVLDAVEMKNKTNALCNRILESDNPKTNSFLYFAVKPKFEVKHDEAAGLLTLQSNWIDYTLKTIPLPDETGAMYYDFCDWMCYLNMRLNPYSTMMLTRLAVNNVLRQEHRFAVHVSASLYPKGKTAFSQGDVTESSHQLSRRLSDDDKKRLQLVDEYRKTFPSVPLEEYRKTLLQKNPEKR
jgi:hypothetical protein